MLNAHADRVIVKPENPEIVTPGGIIIPATLDQKIQKGTIFKIGSGKLNHEGKFIPTSLKEGDKIIFSPYAGLPIIVGDEKYLVMTEADVMALYDDSDGQYIKGDGKARIAQ